MVLAGCDAGTTDGARPQPGSVAGVATPVPAPEPTMLFRDATAGSGLRFRHRHFGSGDKALPETMGAGAALFDYDRDGVLDAFLVQGLPLDGTTAGPAATSRLFRGLGDGRFEDITDRMGAGVALPGMGVAVADVDGDGWTDLLVTGYGGNRMLRNAGGLRFDDVTAGAGLAGSGWSASAAFLDADQDGDLDLYVTRYVDWSWRNHPGCGPPGIPRSYCHPDAFHGQTDLLYRNLGDGRFVEVGGEAGVAVAGGAWEAKGLGVAVADVDDDGRDDIYVANDSTRNFLFLGSGDGKFEDASLSSGTGYNSDGQTEAGMGIAAGDVDGDGRIDLFVTHLEGESNTLYLNLGGGLFRDASGPAGVASASTLPLVGFGTALLDVDRDGDLDLIVANGHVLDTVELERPGVSSYAQPLVLFGNDGSGRFRDVSATAGPMFAEPLVGRGLAVGDVDDDGDPDLLVTVNDGDARLLINETPARGRWLGLELNGRRPNRLALGARIELSVGGRTLVREVRTSGSYLSASDPRVLFGLGHAPGAVRLAVRWPTGGETEIEQPPLDRYLVVRQDDGGRAADRERQP